jgi:hypothetical protein
MGVAIPVKCGIDARTKKERTEGKSPVGITEGKIPEVEVMT